MVYHSDQTFTKNDFKKQDLGIGEYEACTFHGCDFLATDLSGCRFIDCQFTTCDLSNAKLHKTSLQDVQFSNCKMIGLAFDTCNAFNFSANFKACILNHSVFFKMKLNRVNFIECQLQDVDFAQAEMIGTSLHKCQLLNANFDHTNIEKADFRDALDFSIDPESNKIKGARFSASSLHGLLDKYQLVIE